MTFKFKKTFLAASLAAAFLVSCGGDEGDTYYVGGEEKGAQPAPAPAGPAIDKVMTSSGYEIPSDAYFVDAPDGEGSDITSAIQIALFEIIDAGVINATLVLPKGEYLVNDTILIDSAVGFTLTGYGISETKLDFTNSVGDDGLRFEGGKDITVRDLSVYEAPKNGIKVTNSNGVHMAYTGTIWEGELNDQNGAYGLYPLQSRNILMEYNYARGSADAGVYVGQSKDIIVRHNIAKENVAGIEIENSFNADVYNNFATGNTGGVLVFDLPGLDQAYGGNIRIFNNEIYANNAENFAGGGAVGIVPPGTGALVFSASNVEMFNNDMKENDTTGILIASYLLADDGVSTYVVGDGSGRYEPTIANGWSPLVKNINIHNNTFARNGADPRGPKIGGHSTLPAFDDIVAGYTLMLGEVFPNVLYGGVGELLSNANQLSAWDGIVSQSAKDDGVDHSVYDAADQICISPNVNANNVSDPSNTGNHLAYENVNMGVVYRTDPTASDAWNENGPDARLLSDRIDNKDRTLQSCTTPLVRLSAATVIINGITYGCNGDDLTEEACSL